MKKRPNPFHLHTVPEVADALDVSERFVRFVLVAMGKPGARYADPAEVRAWILSHPEFRCHQVTGRVWNRPPSEGPRNGAAGNADLSQDQHDLQAAEQRFPEVRHVYSAK